MEEKRGRSRMCSYWKQNSRICLRKKGLEKYKTPKSLLVIATLGFYLFFFFPLSLLLTATYPNQWFGCTDAYFEKYVFTELILGKKLINCLIFFKFSLEIGVHSGKQPISASAHIPFPGSGHFYILPNLFKSNRSTKLSPHFRLCFYISSKFLRRILLCSTQQASISSSLQQCQVGEQSVENAEL